MSRSKKYEQLVDKYNKNPNLCLYCGKKIICKDNDTLSAVKIKKFCDSSCAASYNNKGVVRNPKGNYENIEYHTGSQSILSKFSDEEIINIYNNSNTIKEFSQNLGYKTSIDTRQNNIRERLNKLGIDFSKFKSKNNNISLNKRKSSRKCSRCDKNISYDNKSGYCIDCYKEIKKLEKINMWLMTGETGCATGSNLRNCIRDYLYKDQDYKCAICENGNTWNGKELKFVLDHIDGDASNNKRENLRLICPNCDSQLDTYKSKNKHSARNYRKKYYQLYKNVS